MLSLELPMWPKKQLFLWCVSVCNFCQFPSVFDPLSAAIFSQGKSSQWCTGIWGGHLPAGYVMSHCMFSQSHTQYALGSSFLPFSKVWLLMLPLLCKVFLNTVLSDVPWPPSCLQVFLYYQGTHALYPITRFLLWIQEIHQCF